MTSTEKRVIVAEPPSQYGGGWTVQEYRETLTESVHVDEWGEYQSEDEAQRAARSIKRNTVRPRR